MLARLVDVAWRGGVFNFGTVLAPPVDVAWRGGGVFNFGAALTPDARDRLGVAVLREGGHPKACEHDADGVRVSMNVSCLVVDGD